MSAINKKTKSKDVILNVSKVDYQAEVTSGIDPEHAMRPGNHTFRRVLPNRLAKAEDVNPRNVKVRITMHIDLDVLNYFKAKAAEKNAAPYQTQINNSLRSYMEGEVTNSKISLLNDERFLTELAQRVAHFVPKKSIKKKKAS